MLSFATLDFGPIADRLPQPGDLRQGVCGTFKVK